MKSDAVTETTIVSELRRLVLFATLPLTIVVCLIGILEYRQVKAAAEQSVRREADRVAHDVQRLLEDTARVIQSLVRRPEVVKMDPERCDPYLAELLVIQLRYGNLAVFNREGRMICGAKPVPAGSNAINASESDWFPVVMSGQALVLGVVRKGPIIGKWVVPMAAPVKSASGEVIGAVVLALDVAAWNMAGAKQFLPLDTSLGVIDKKGTIVLRAEDPAGWVGRRFGGDTSLAAKAVAAKEAFVAAGAGGTERLWAMSPIPNSDWIAYAGVKTDAVYWQPLRQAVVLACVAFLTLIAGLWAALKTAKKIACPISDLAATADAVAAGDVAARAGKPVIAELAVVSGQFNRMLNTLSSHEAALRASELQYRGFIESINEGVLILDRIDAITYMNKCACGLLGYAAEELTGKPAALLLDEPNRRTLQEQLALSRQGSTVKYEITWLRKDGACIDTLISASPRMDGAGGYDGTITVMADITESKRSAQTERGLEAQLHRRQRMEALGTLADGIAHDFNNILTAILGNADLARMDLPANHAAIESLDEIVKSGARARDLVRQILLLAEPQEQKLRTVDLKEIVEGAVRLLRAILPARIQLDTRIKADVRQVSIDTAQIQQAIKNLATNAAQAIGDRAGRIEFLLENVTVNDALIRVDLPPGEYVRLSVMDTGEGIDPQSLERIFDPFFSTRAPGTGTGLGLSVVESIVKGHGGTIAVTSELGKGSTFHLYFPAIVQEDAAVKAPDMGPARALASGKRILYLDDEQALIALATRLLRRMGYTVTAFTHPAEAIEAFRADPSGFDLFVTDFNMPKISGLETAEAVRRIRPEMRILMSSGYITEDLRTKARALGVLELLYKPLSIEDLVAAIERAISQQSA